MTGQRQQGVALIKAMLVVALATSVAVAMVSRQQFDIRRTGNLLQAEQSELYADGVEAWAAQLLRRDREDNKVDHEKEEWASILPPIPVEGGSVSGHIKDLSGRFNLNSLVVAGKQEPKAVARFRRLLQALELNPELAMVVADWLDPDLEPGYPGGAEDDIYLGREQPYRTANGPIYSSSELLLLDGMDAEGFARLQPHVSALPVGTKLNVNTATAPVLMSLVEGLGPAEADALIEGRGEEGYGDVTGFAQQEALAGRELESDILAVESEYFLIVSQIQFGALTQQRYSVLRRDKKGAASILMHAQGSY